MKNRRPQPNGRSHINRRAFLRGAGGVAIALPFLEGYRSGRRSARCRPTRCSAFFICTANGVVQAGGGDPERFWPTALGAIDTAKLTAATDRCTSILADHASRLLFVKGINYPNGGTGCGHASGLAQTPDRARAHRRRQQGRFDGRVRRHHDRQAGEPGGRRSADALLGAQGRLHQREAVVQRGGAGAVRRGQPVQRLQEADGHRDARTGDPGGGSTIDRSARQAAEERQRPGPRRAELAPQSVRPVERRQDAPRSALQLHPRSREHHDRHGHAVLDERASTSTRSTRSTPAARSARTGRSKRSPSCRWTWSGSRSPAT